MCIMNKENLLNNYIKIASYITVIFGAVNVFLKKMSFTDLLLIMILSVFSFYVIYSCKDEPTKH